MIVLTIPCLLRGGTEFQTLHLVKALLKQNQSVLILVYFEVDEAMLEIYRKTGAEVKCLKWQRSIKPWQFIVQLKKILKDVNPKLVHVQYMAPGALPILAAKLAEVKRIIATVHQPYTESHGWKAKLLLRIAARFCRPFLAVSQNAEQSWFGSSKLIQKDVPIMQQPKHLTFYNMVDVEAIMQIAAEVDIELERDRYGLKDKVIIGTVSRLRHEKGIDILLTAFAEFVQKNDQLHLLIVGDGPDRGSYEAFVRKNNIATHVTFFGAAQWEKAIALMQLMDLVVIPSRFEGFGLSAAEAMALGKPIVAANNFGLKELITDQKEGLLFTNEDAKALTKALSAILNDPAKAKSQGDAAKAKVKELFDRPVFEQNVKTLYQL
jgi:glycosyltransferase involved in cell wall biosynthesis